MSARESLWQQVVDQKTGWCSRATRNGYTMELWKAIKNGGKSLEEKPPHCW